MPRLLAALVISAALLPVARPAPVPNDRPKGVRIDFPTTVGTEWVYERGDKQEWVEAIIGAEKKGGAALLTVSYGLRGSVYASEEMLVSAEDGLLSVEMAGKAIDPPRCLARSVLRKGDEWEIEMPAGDKWTYTVRGTERVVVPAGRYEAVRVDQEYAYRGKTVRSTSWYAPGVGVVKKERGTAVHDLKSFTPGKE